MCVSKHCCNVNDARADSRANSIDTLLSIRAAKKYFALLTRTYKKIIILSNISKIVGCRYRLVPFSTISISLILTLSFSLVQSYRHIRTDIISFKEEKITVIYLFYLHLNKPVNLIKIHLSIKSWLVPPSKRFACFIYKSCIHTSSYTRRGGSWIQHRFLY